MSRKLAVVISGAVSLGSYEAGVIYEVLEAIARHNEKLENNDERIEIDVITGASAGGMTACVLAQHLLCSDRTLRKPSENPLYNAWVKDVDIRELLKVDVKDHIYSLLQSGVVENIGKKSIKDEPLLTDSRHPAAASEIQIGIAMSNLNGYNYEIAKKKEAQEKSSNKGETRFGYTQYKDQFVCVARRDNNRVTLREKTLLEGEERDTWEEFRETNWSELREVGLSSGAFPFAFRARKIKRDGGKREINGKKNRFYQRTGDYWYVDGGVFENEPIGIAQALVAELDGNTGSSSTNEKSNQRYYLYIAPGERQLPENPLLEDDNNLLQVGGALIGSIFQQARFQDWIIKGFEEPIFSITATDYQLLGDVFSAFAGFLEEKFRAYDYNIGRERARATLQSQDPRSLLAGLLEYDLVSMPDIEWKVEKGKSKIGNNTATSWTEAKTGLELLAKPLNQNNNPRDQLGELKRLMAEVDRTTRQEILDQLISRLDSLIVFINSEYLDPLDQKDLFSGWIKLAIRKQLGEPLTNFVLKQWATLWLKRNILDLP